MTDQQALEIIIGLFTGSYASQLALMVAILSSLMTLFKRWDKLDILFNKLPKGAKSFVPIILGGLLGLCQGLIMYTTPLGLALSVGNGLLVLGGGQIVLYQIFKHTPAETLLHAGIELITKQLPKEK